MTRLTITLLLALGCGGGTSAAPTATTTTPPPSVEMPPAGDLDAVLASAHRSDENKARDRWRHPKETLTFFGLRPDMRVIEVSPGRGWYTEVLAPYLRGTGTLVAAVPSAEGSRARYRQSFLDMVAERPSVYEGVEVATFDPPGTIDLGPDGSADLVLTFRNTHNWINDGGEEAAYSAFFRVLKPGGVLGVVQHRAPEGANAPESARTGYVPEAYVIETATAAGFVLEERSEINANPADDHDHPEGVWSLPPVLRLGDQDRAQYEAIGESDRMTLRFRKPAAPPA